MDKNKSCDADRNRSVCSALQFAKLSLFTAFFGILAPVFFLKGSPLVAAESATNKFTPGDEMLARYFKNETAKISASCMTDIQSLDDWQRRQPELRRQAAEMLGLDPMPPRTDLHPVITGKIERDDFTVEKLYFQSQPHLYVTGDLYLPKRLSRPAPAILYLCGHSPVISNGVSYGNKTAYQRHGIWFARNGFICLVIDTLQWGEITGHHYGTYSESSWWWNSRGYTPAGVETWNAIRALDYLDSRPEVDREKIGVTGRSGGGAYSWFVSALDDRPKVIVPVAGITDVRNYVVDGAVDDHCDCMFFVNTYRWDYPQLAALSAPRQLLLGNSDADSLFPLDGVMRTHTIVKRIYDLYGNPKDFGLVIDPGPHNDTPELQVAAFRWFNIHLKHADPVIAMAATNMFLPQELKVFGKIPEDQINSTIQNNFVPAARTPTIPATKEAWSQLTESWMQGLREKCFAAWPTNATPLTLTKLYSQSASGIRYEAYEFQSETNVSLQFYLMCRTGHVTPQRIMLHVAGESFTNATADPAAGLNSALPQTKRVFGEAESTRFVKEILDSNVAHIIFLPRGIGASAWSGGNKRLTQIRRRFMILGETLDGMRVWDIRRAVQSLQSIEGFHGAPVELDADGDMAVNALYASLFESAVHVLDLHRVPASHMEGPDYLNVLKILDIPEAAAMAANHCDVYLEPSKAEGWDFLRTMASNPPAGLHPVSIK